MLPATGPGSAITHPWPAVGLHAGIDLAAGEVLGIVRRRHRSAELVEFHQALDRKYPAGPKIQGILANHSAHTAKETKAYLTTAPGRFDLVFTPTHASWLNLIEMFFAKLSKSLLSGIRVDSYEDLEGRIQAYLDWLNTDPVPFRRGWQPQDAHEMSVT